MNHLDLFHFALAIVGITVGIRVLRLVLVLHNVLRLRWQRGQVRLVDASAVPSHVPEGLRTPIAQLEGLGFERVGWLSMVSALQSKYAPRFVAWMYHPDNKTYASAGFSNEVEPFNPFAVIFSTFLDDERSIQTVNGISHGYVADPPGTIVVDPYASTITQQWKAHCEVLNRHRTRPTDVTPDQAAQRCDATENAAFQELCQSGTLVPAESWHHLSWRAAFQVSLRLVRGQKQVAQMRQAQMRVPGVGEQLPPIEEEVRAYLTQDELMRTPSRRNFYLWVFIATLLLFGLALVARSSLSYAVIVIVVLMLHEYGHYFAMQRCGYQDTTIFFVPFIGAIASGRKQGVTLNQEMLILLAGPMPGIILALLAAWLGALRIPGAETVILMLIILNGFNLLPILPLDGGRILQVLIFARRPILDLIARILAVAAFGMLAIATKSVLAFVLVLGMLVSISHGRRLAALRRAIPKLAKPLESQDEVKRIAQAMRELGFAKLPFAKRVALARAAHAQSSQVHNIGCATVLGWLLVYASLWVLVPVATYLTMRTAHSTEERQAPAKRVPPTIAAIQCPMAPALSPHESKAPIFGMGVFANNDAASVASPTLSVDAITPLALGPWVFLSRTHRAPSAPTRTPAERNGLDGLPGPEIMKRLSESGGKFIDLRGGASLSVECRIETDRALGIDETLADYFFYDGADKPLIPPPWSLEPGSANTNGEVPKARRTLRLLTEKEKPVQRSLIFGLVEGNCNSKSMAARVREKRVRAMRDTAAKLRAEEPLDEEVVRLAIDQASLPYGSARERAEAALRERVGGLADSSESPTHLWGHATQVNSKLHVNVHLLVHASVAEVTRLLQWLCSNKCDLNQVSLEPRTTLPGVEE